MKIKNDLIETLNKDLTVPIKITIKNVKNIESLESLVPKDLEPIKTKNFIKSFKMSNKNIEQDS